MDYEAVIRAVELRARELGSEHAAEELKNCTPERARRVLVALENGDYYDELPMLHSAASVVYGDRDFVSMGGIGSVEDVLEGAGIEPYDGYEADADVLTTTNDKGYYEGLLEAIEQTARRVLGLEL